MARASIAFRPYFSFFAFFNADSSLREFNETGRRAKGLVGSHLCGRCGMIVSGINSNVSNWFSISPIQFIMPCAEGKFGIRISLFAHHWIYDV